VKAGGGLGTLELLVASAVALLAAAALGHAALLHGRVSNHERASVELREALRRVLDLASREIRGAGFDPSSAGPFEGRTEGVLAAATSRIELCADRHGLDSADPPDGQCDSRSDERISFYGSSSGALFEGVGRQSLPLLPRNVIAPRGFEFGYLDACAREIAPPDDGELPPSDRPRIRAVRIRLRLEDPTSALSVSGESLVALRNRAIPCTP
jgi:hypothetical protein